MEGIRLIVLTFGFCLFISYINNSAGVQLHGKDPTENMNKKLETLQEQRENLETRIADPKTKNKGGLQKELTNVISQIRSTEASCKVSYTDYKSTKKHLKKEKAVQKKRLEREQARQTEEFKKERDVQNAQFALERAQQQERMEKELAQQKKNFKREKGKLEYQFEKEKTALKTDFVKEKTGKEKQFEKEKKKLLKDFEDAEKKRMQAIHAYNAMRTEGRKEISTAQENVKAMTKERDRIAKEFAEFTKTQNRHRENLTQEKNQLLKEREGMTQKLKEAQDLHSKALEAMAEATQEGYRPVTIPYHDEIKKLEKSVSVSNKDEQAIVDGLLETQAKLKDMLQKLYDESELSAESAHKDLEAELKEMEKESVRLREEHKKQRKDILDNIKSKGLGEYTAEEIQSLKQANQEVAGADKTLQEVARRSAYLKGISQVADLIKQCSKAITDKARGTVLVQGKGLQKTVNLNAANNQALGLKGIASLSDTNQDQEEAESIRNVIHQRGLLYNDLFELYRTKLSTEIVNGLTQVNKILPIPLPGCSITNLTEIRDAAGKWMERVQYALRLSKELYKGDNRSMIEKFFARFMSNLRDALFTLAGREVSPNDGLEDDEEMTASMEKFEKDDDVDLYKHYQFVRIKLMFLLEVDGKFTEEELKEFRYNFLFVKKAPKVLEKMLQGMLQELNTGVEEGEAKQLAGLDSVLEEMDSTEERLRQLFSVLISRVKSTINKQGQEYQAALEEYKKCRLNLFKGLPLFGKMN